MFKIPEWEDVPKSNFKLMKNGSDKKKNSRQNVKDKTIKKAKAPVTKTITKVRSVKSKKNPIISPLKSTTPDSKKRKQNTSDMNSKKKKINNVDIQTYDSDKPDEVLLNAKKKKFNETFENDDSEDLLFSDRMNTSQITDKVNNNKQVTRHTKSKSNDSKKTKLKLMLESNRNSIKVTNSNLRERMLQKLKAAQFRYLNEKLYTSSGSEAQQLFQSDPAAFHTYHEGYQQQVKKWPVNPLDVIVKRIMKMPKTSTIADMGCGEAALSRRVPHTVRSFDLVAAEAAGGQVEQCDMAHTPLLAASIDAAVYCLALMGTDLTQYLVEANRVLKDGGHLLIAEVESRFDNVDTFIQDVQKLGFKLKHLDKSHTVFFFMEFIKVRPPPAKKAKLPVLTLKPCLYKRR